MLVDRHVLTHHSMYWPVIVAGLTGANVSNHQSRVALHTSSLPGGHARCLATVWIFLLHHFGPLSLNSTGLSTARPQCG